MSVKLNPYLNFTGSAKEAMEFYHDVFGGELKISTFGDTPGMEIPEDMADKIMHAELATDDLTIMGSDAMGEHETKPGDNIGISLSGDDKDKLTGYFNALSEGGEVSQKLEKAPWGDSFGMLKDKFGIRWLVNIAGA